MSKKLRTISDMDAIAKEANARLLFAWREANFAGDPPKISTAVVRIVLEIADAIALLDKESVR